MTTANTNTEKSFLDMSINEMITATGESISSAYDAVTTTTLDDIGTEVASWFTTPEQPLTQAQMRYAIHMHAMQQMMNAAHLTDEQQAEWHVYYVQYYTWYYVTNHGYQA